MIKPPTLARFPRGESGLGNAAADIQFRAAPNKE